MMRRNRPYPLNNLPAISDLRELAEKKAASIPDKIAFAWYSGKDSLEEISFRSFAQDIERLATWLYQKGCRDKKIAILGENSYEWLLVFMAAVNSGNIAVAMDKDMTLSEVSELIKKTDVEVLFWSGACCRRMQAEEGKDSFAPKISLFSFENMQRYLKEGESILAQNNTEYRNYEIDPDRPASIFFTSGTTGDRKGVVLSHRNIATDINGGCNLYKLEGSTYAVLPFHHVFGLFVGVWDTFNYGYTTYLNLSLKRIRSELPAVKPQTMVLVPLFVEMFHKQIWDTARKEKKERKLKLAMKVSSLLYHMGIDVRRKLFRQVLSSFGGKMEFILCGGAALDVKYEKEFHIFGIDIINGYGITECSSGVSINRNLYVKGGSVGFALPGIRLKIADDGEILVSGPQVMLGYYNDQETTEAVLKDGWYATGDLGYIDEDGFLFIQGRKKNLIILANGENISPEELEQKIYGINGVKEVIVSEREGKIHAEIYPEKSTEEICSSIKNAVDSLNRSLPFYKRIANVSFRDTEFEKTTTKKIKR